MTRWSVDEPTTLEFDGVVALKATLVAGSVSVLAGDKPSVRVSEISGKPLSVVHEAGMLTISQEVVEGVLGLLKNERTEAVMVITVPAGCPVALKLVSADAVVSGLTARTVIRSGAGNVTIDGVTGDVDATTVSGEIEAQGLRGSVRFNSVSGALSLAGGMLDRLAAKTASAKITADIALNTGSQVQVNTVTGEVALRLPAATSAEVTLTSLTGRVDSAFPELESGMRGVARAKSMTGRLGSGAGKLSVNTVSGSVTLLARPQDAALEEK